MPATPNFACGVETAVQSAAKGILSLEYGPAVDVIAPIMNDFDPTAGAYGMHGLSTQPYFHSKSAVNNSQAESP